MLRCFYPPGGIEGTFRDWFLFAYFFLYIARPAILCNGRVPCRPVQSNSFGNQTRAARGFFFLLRAADEMLVQRDVTLFCLLGSCQGLRFQNHAAGMFLGAELPFRLLQDPGCGDVVVSREREISASIIRQCGRARVLGERCFFGVCEKCLDTDLHFMTSERWLDHIL